MARKTVFTIEEMRDYFWERVDIRLGFGPHGNCFRWAGTLTDEGYGVINMRGRTMLAHRASFYIRQGRPPDPKLLICHHCDNRACVRPEHLFEGTHSDNLKDLYSKKLREPPLRTPGTHTHCVNGHELTPDNTYHLPNSLKRACRICREASFKKYRSRKAAERSLKRAG